MRMVDKFQHWLHQPVPSVDQARQEIALLWDRDTRRLYKEHLAARWVWPANVPHPAGLKMLLPLVLIDGTRLDAVLARLTLTYLPKMDDGDLLDAVEITAKYLLNSRPWDLGVWK